MINTEFLNSLYKAKFNAEQQIEEQEKLREFPVSHDEADKIYAVREERETQLNSKINLLENLIKLYLSHHNQ